MFIGIAAIRLSPSSALGRQNAPFWRRSESLIASFQARSCGTTTGGGLRPPPVEPLVGRQPLSGWASDARVGAHPWQRVLSSPGPLGHNWVYPLRSRAMLTVIRFPAATGWGQLGRSRKRGWANGMPRRSSFGVRSAFRTCALGRAPNRAARYGAGGLERLGVEALGPPNSYRPTSTIAFPAARHKRRPDGYRGRHPACVDTHRHLRYIDVCR